MILPGDCVLAAVSGGGDSVLMLHLLAALRGSIPFTLEAAHLNHGLRGAESDADEAFVRDLAGRLSIFLSADGVDLTRRPGEPSSLEERARDARRAFLLRTARDRACGRIALGHTLDDQAETILMWLLRGTGRGGLAGMEPVTPEGLIRPLIRARRSEVRDHLRAMGEPFRDDPTNDDSARTRSWIRLRLIPRIEEGFPEAVARIGALAEGLRGEERLLDELASALIREPDGALVTEGGAAGRDRPLAARAARLAAARAGMDAGLLDRDHVEAILDLARSGAEGRGIDLPGGFRAEKRGGAVVFTARERSGDAQR